MTDDLVKRLREYAKDDNAGWCDERKAYNDAADHIEQLNEEVKRARNTSQLWKDNHLAGNKRIEQLEAALRKLDDMVLELDAGDLDAYEVGDFIDTALAGEKKDD